MQSFNHNPPLISYSISNCEHSGDGPVKCVNLGFDNIIGIGKVDCYPCGETLFSL